MTDDDDDDRARAPRKSRVIFFNENAACVSVRLCIYVHHLHTICGCVEERARSARGTLARAELSRRGEVRCSRFSSIYSDCGGGWPVLWAELKR